MSSQTKQKIAVLFGGRSCEHEVSVSSARAMLPHIDRDRFDIVLIGITKQGDWRLLNEGSNALAQASVDADGTERLMVDHNGNAQFLVSGTHGASALAVDVVFPLLHGPFGEDGTVQGLLELAGIPIIGCGVAASALGMDKELSKRMFKAEGLAQVEYTVVRRSRWQQRADAVLLEVAGQLGFPVYVKPARMGSSVGVSRANSAAELRAALNEAARFDTKMIIETAALGYREIECAVLGNEAPEASVVGEITPASGFYDYAAKYVTGTSKVTIPAQISNSTSAQIRAMAVTAFRAIGASGLARVDFFVAPDDTILINEVNTMPGFTPVSMYPQLWEASGVSYGELISRLAELALARHAEHTLCETSM